MKSINAFPLSDPDQLSTGGALDRVKTAGEIVAEKSVVRITFPAHLQGQSGSVDDVIAQKVQKLLELLNTYGVTAHDDNRVVQQNTAFLSVVTTTLVRDSVDWTKFLSDDTTVVIELAPWDLWPAPSREAASEAAKLTEKIKVGVPFVTSFFFEEDAKTEINDLAYIETCVSRCLEQDLAIQGCKVRFTQWTRQPDGKNRIDVRIEPKVEAASPPANMFLRLLSQEPIVDNFKAGLEVAASFSVMGGSASILDATTAAELIKDWLKQNGVIVPPIRYWDFQRDSPWNTIYMKFQKRESTSVERPAGARP